jgi:hypothetical protein
MRDDETKMILGTQLQIATGNNEIHEKIYSQEQQKHDTKEYLRRK